LQLAGALLGSASVPQAINFVKNNKKNIPEKVLNPNTQWLRDARWGLFAHYLVHMPSAPVSESMTGKIWNEEVNSFRTHHINDHGGTVTWGLPLSDAGIIAENYFKQVKALSNRT